MPASPTLDRNTILRLVHAEHDDPFSILGPHLSEDGQAVFIRVLWPGVDHVEVVERESNKVLATCDRVHPTGLFEGRIEGATTLPRYWLRVHGRWGEPRHIEDAYSHGSAFTEEDLWLLAEGTHYSSYQILGSHVVRMGDVPGVRFGVWAPNARRVSVVGDFNDWDGRRHAMRRHPNPGIWEIFVPRIGVGAKYKYEIASRLGGPPALKADPYGFSHEMRPQTASVVYDITPYEWSDDEWMERRRQTDWNKEPINIYEVHLGSWARDPDNPRQPLGYRDLAHRLSEYCKDMSYTHVELLPVTEFPYDPSWGYQPLGQFAPTIRYGSPADFQYFMNHLHEEGVGVILDWVPAHFPKDAHGLARFDGTPLYEHPDPRLGEHMDWGSLIYNYGRFEVKNFLLTAGLFWLDKYHIDGMRVDAVASMLYLDYSRNEGEWVPNKYGGRENLEAIDFIKSFNDLVHERHPGVLTIAEESTSWPMVSRPSHLGGLGFSMKWNMGWMHDALEYFQMDPIFRKFHHNKITFSIWYAYSENFILSISHDEVVHLKKSMLEKMPGDLWMKFAGMRLFLAYMYAHPGKKLLFQGAEIGQWHEWKFEDSLDWHLLEREPHGCLSRFSRDLNHLYISEPALHEVDFDSDGFQWIDFHNSEMSILAWLRYAEDRNDYLLIVCNFTPIIRFDYRLGVPEPGHFQEIFNSDSGLYWGSDVGNFGGVSSEPVPINEREHSIRVVLPPLSVMIFKPTTTEPNSNSNSEEKKSRTRRQETRWSSRKGKRTKSAEKPAT